MQQVFRFHHHISSTRKITSSDYQWSLCGTLKVISILMGMHIGLAKYCCFLCLWDNHSRCYCGSLWKATFVHKKLVSMFLEWTLNSVQELSILH